MAFRGLCKTAKPLLCVYTVSARCHTHSDPASAAKDVALSGVTPVLCQASQRQAEFFHSPVLVAGHGGFLSTLLQLHLLFLSFREPSLPGGGKVHFLQNRNRKHLIFKCCLFTSQALSYLMILILFAYIITYIKKTANILNVLYTGLQAPRDSSVCREVPRGGALCSGRAA